MALQTWSNEETSCFPYPLSLTNVTSLPGTQLCKPWEPDASATSMLAETSSCSLCSFPHHSFARVLLFGGT